MKNLIVIGVVLIPLFFITSLISVNAQKFDTLSMLSVAIDSNHMLFREIARKSDFSGKEVICVRIAYKSLPLVPTKIFNLNYFNIVVTDTNDLFYNQVRKFFTVSKIKVKRQYATLSFEIEDLSEKIIFSAGYFRFRIINGEWVYDDIKFER
jgi:hypothetical protein